MVFNQRAFHNLQSYLICWYIKMFKLIRHTFCESLVKICATKHKCRSFLWNFPKMNEAPTQNIVKSHFLYKQTSYLDPIYMALILKTCSYIKFDDDRIKITTSREDLMFFVLSFQLVPHYFIYELSLYLY